jgi:hypothetical protein
VSEKTRTVFERIGYICKGCGRSYCTHIGPYAMNPPEGACFWPKKTHVKPNWRPLYSKEIKK